MSFVSLYRKYRSQTFGDLIGQDHVVRTLQNGIASGRIAHSYLFTGPRGTGKTSSARLLAKALCCEKGPLPEPCNECVICKSITEGNCIDVFEMDAASESGVEQVRETIVDVVEYKPAMARYRVFIIDEVHDLSGKAFDALLKTIEEPPEHIIFILATTEYNKVPPTIRSRCQKFEFHRASMQDLIHRLEHVTREEGVEAEPAALAAIARMADGGYRDGLTLLEQAILTTRGSITLQDVYDQLGLVGEEAADELLLAIRESNVPRLVELTSELTRLGRDPRAILESLLYRAADLTRAAFGIEEAGGDATREAATHETAVRIGQEALLQIRAQVAEAHKVIRDISLPRLWLESELIRIGQDLNRPAAAAAPAREAPKPAAEPAKPVAQPKREPASEPVAAAVVHPTQEPGPPEKKSGHELLQVAEPEPTGDPALDHARHVWAEVLRELPADKPMGMKMSKSEVVAFKENLLTVEVGKQTSDWIAEDHRKLAFLQKLLRKHGSEEWQLKVHPRKQAKGAVQSDTVELPAEGQQLRDMARQVFGA